MPAGTTGVVLPSCTKEPWFPRTDGSYAIGQVVCRVLAEPLVCHNQEANQTAAESGYLY